MSISIPANVNFFVQNFNKNFLGLDPSSLNYGEESSDLWLKFIELNQVSESQAMSDPNGVETLYAQFAAQQLSDSYQIESIVDLTPDEIFQRNILFETFSIILKMLNVLQTNLRVISQALYVNAKAQDEYTNLMTKIPLYAPQASSNITWNSNNIGQTTLGYSNVSIQDVIKYLLNQAITTNTSQVEYDLSAQTYIQLNYDSVAKTAQARVSINTAPGQNFSNVYYDSDTIPLDTTSIDARGTVGSIINSLQNAFMTNTGDATYAYTYEQIRSMLLSNPTFFGAGTPWSSIVNISSDQSTNDAQSGLRGELNGRLQLNIENARALRQQIKDRAQPLNDLVSQIKDATSTQSNLLSSFTESMKGIISAIYR